MLPVLSALFPVILLTAIGYASGKLRLIRAEGLVDLSNLVFLVLAPALFFRTMSGVQPAQVALAPLVVYFAASLVLMLSTLLVRGWTRESAMQGLTASFSNTFLVGVPVVTFVYGPAGLAHLLALITLHAVVLLTAGTLALELAPGASRAGHPARAVLQAVRSSIIHPVPLPILAGLAWGQTGWALPELIDTSLRLLSQAVGPLSLLMVGVSLASIRVGDQWRGALTLALLKTVVHPLLVLAVGLAAGLSGLPFAVMVVAACLPTGANVFILAKRYKVADEQVTAAVALSTLLALVSVTTALSLLPRG
ncbi:AEC family transporter [Ramlibacter sp. AW1]|uniref:AEC family transporter n=1 Tax=Ramlibacter aurantiacus TaxID=2801330 RepID=A0A937D757_9BURK|nr:AEC family transporter [Ramlibacter aurantiacus]MBL0422992.1 AEC family transporter [Ramlibacter aurantiacus]